MPGRASVRLQASVYHRLNTNWRHEEIGVDDILLPSRRVFKYVISNHVELMTIPNDRFIIHSVVETSTGGCSHGGKELFQPWEEFVPTMGRVCSHRGNNCSRGGKGLHIDATTLGKVRRRIRADCSIPCRGQEKSSHVSAIR